MSLEETATVSVPAEQPTTPAPAETANTVVPAGDYRVFVGRLNRGTKKADIRAHFETVGEVRKVTIPFRKIKKGTKLVPSGIAFVSFTSEETMKKAVEQLDKSQLLEREIVVQPARPVQVQPKKKNAEKEEEEGDETTPKESTETVKNEEKSKEEVSTPATAATEKDEAVNKSEEASADSEKSKKKKQQKRSPKSNKSSSKVKPLPPHSIYVSGLSPTLSNEGLKELFAAYNPTRARVAVRALPPYIIRRIKVRGEQRRGRGFGFVSFGTAEDQAKAIEEMNGKKVEDRDLVVKVAVSKNEAEEEKPAAPVPASEESSEKSVPETKPSGDADSAEETVAPTSAPAPTETEASTQEATSEKPAAATATATVEATEATNDEQAAASSA
ncbi:single-stranded telomeric binding protein Tgc1 [Schizosaccharomyces japonicus yFS275]|uniref:Single-stranded telomeric binding protein Tgc1 n=1 Tax=Schizosaccharomyces japonicus (strain yFS275 / FY16936) TaxID=402676 RepID=B6K7Z0_SCHJY|nr:single-stranded telomeric binding protein Tgc1 [Schizosaccharomyces japonicus yFS275]EEB09644.1 single-stranded telomeric binding protein Tgc1 [Schizosaccharomyces japonicus yFS275]